MLLRMRGMRGGREQGSALLAVLGVMAVFLVVGATIAAVTIDSLGFTSGTRAGVQSEAAAEAGVDFAAAQLMAGHCQTTYTDADATAASGSASGVTFTARVSSRAADGDAWTDACPTSSSTQLRVLSTGSAATPAVAGDDGSDTSTVEALYSVSASSAPGTGAAVYAYSASGFSASGRLVAPSGLQADVEIRHGDVTCSGSGDAPGDLVVADGSLTMSGSCSVSGNAWASKTLTLSGSVTLGGTGVASDIGLSGSSTIAGSAWASDAITLPWSTQIGGAATAATLKLNGGNIKGSAWASGAAVFNGSTIDGHLTARSVSGSGSAKGGTTIVPAGPGSGMPAPAAPPVPDWVDFGYSASDWSGFQTVTLTGGCDYAALTSAVASLHGAKGVIDATRCSKPVTIAGSDRLALPADLAIFAKSFSLGASGGFTSSAARKLWLVTPDTVADGQPTCLSGSSFSVGGSFSLDTTISAIIYTPCSVTIGSSNRWYGQIFGGAATISGDARLTYAPLGLPGVNLVTGGTEPAPSARTFTRLSLRDVEGGR